MFYRYAWFSISIGIHSDYYEAPCRSRAVASRMSARRVKTPWWGEGRPYLDVGAGDEPGLVGQHLVDVVQQSEFGRRRLEAL